MDKLEEIIEREFGCISKSEFCAYNFSTPIPGRHNRLCPAQYNAAARRAVREALGLVTELCDRYDTAAFIDEDWLIDQIRALAASLEDKS